MSPREIIDKLKVLLGMAEAPAEAPAEQPAETAPAEAKPEEQPAETAVEQPAEEQPAETKLAEESEQKPEGEEEKPAEQPAPAPEEVPVEKRVADLEAKFDEMFGLLQKLAEREAKVETDDKPAPASATPAHFAKQETPKPMTKAERIIALKNNQL